ncbi:ATP-binding cassette sub-family G member 5 [Penicillium subrubescens]|uniref:ATP-binding cassette sub-family G member 5 n=1 Tax=Penicillium subrubescens TaxID=1316194 RepID=UPI0025459277|nr:ATP-binding cassette sub-family G member 5 [Penicillium subrubescens]KAJ5896563.1 ATP-binding cassette sub-family G member 5 [Penicillium subrubescens]
MTAFLNDLWMCVDGFLAPMDTLNVFWKYVFHYIDYQAYVFQGMMINEFQDRVYQCVKSAEDTYQCSYPSDLKSVGQIRGTDVLKMFSIDTGLEGTCFGSMIGIIVGYRLLASIVLVIRK